MAEEKTTTFKLPDMAKDLEPSFRISIRIDSRF